MEGVPAAGVTVIVTSALLLNWESLPVSLMVYAPATVKAADVTTGFTWPAISVNVEDGSVKETGPGPLVRLHVAVRVVPAGSPSSVTLPVNAAHATPGPILFAAASLNHTFPSGPAAIASGSPPAVGTKNSVITPAGVILPILFAAASLNHTLPSGPAVIQPIWVLVGTENSVMTPAVVIR